MNSQIHAMTEIGRMRREEAIARAENYRLAQIAKRRTEEAERPGERRLSPAWVLVYRKALKIAALSIVVITGIVVF